MQKKRDHSIVEWDAKTTYIPLPARQDNTLKMTSTTNLFKPFEEMNTTKTFLSNNKKKLPRSAKYRIDSLKSLNQLFEEMDADENNRHNDLRFLIDPDFKLWFAKETHQGNMAPAHYQMTGEDQRQATCISAGNLDFSIEIIDGKKHRTLTYINNKSGDFEPSFDSLKWLLAILFLNEETLPFKIGETLIIDKLVGTAYSQKLKLDTSELRQNISDNMPVDNDSLTNQLHESTETEYKIEQRSPAFFTRDTSGSSAFQPRSLFQGLNLPASP